MTRHDDRMGLPTLHERIRVAIELTGIGRPQVADRLGVSPQAIVKWLQGGGIGDDKLQGLARLAGPDFLALKYGTARKPEPMPPDQQQHETSDTLARVQAIDILDALPTEQRDLWLSLGNLLVERFAKREKANPFPHK